MVYFINNKSAWMLDKSYFKSKIIEKLNYGLKIKHTLNKKPRKSISKSNRPYLPNGLSMLVPPVKMNQI